MQLTIWYPEYRDDFDYAFQWLTGGLDPSEQLTHETDEIIGKAVDSVEEAVEYIREYLNDEFGSLEDASFEIDSKTVALIATAIALEELEDWSDAIREDIVYDLARGLEALYRYEKSRSL